MDEALKKWRQEGKHLPDFLKDFHDQKDFFKMMHECLQPIDGSPANSINMTQGHIYTLDSFLYFCARFGYTLQKSRAHQNFEDVHQAINVTNQIRNDKFNELLLKPEAQKNI